MISDQTAQTIIYFGLIGIFLIIYFDKLKNIIFRFFRFIKYLIYVKFYLTIKKKKEIKKYENSKDEFNKSLDMDAYYAMHLNRKDLYFYLKDLRHRREISHNTNNHSTFLKRKMNHGFN